MRVTWLVLSCLALLACSDRPSPPLALVFAPDSPSDGVETVEAAAQEWNDSVGEQLFHPVEPGATPGCDRVYVKFIDAMPAPYPELIGLFEQVGCHYQISILRDYARDRANAAHELGHALDLDHSDDRTSIMFHMASRHARITVADIARVQKRWGL